MIPQHPNKRGKSHFRNVTDDRFVPPRRLLLKRFDLVNRVYGAIIDAKTKQPLFRAEALEAIKNLRVHISRNCLSDPPGIPLYFEDGKDSLTGNPKLRCVRGTNDLEGYHFHMRLLTAWCLSPLLAHYVLLEHNYRWNLRQQVTKRGLDPAVGNFYDQPVIEAIQVFLFPKCQVSVCRFADSAYGCLLYTSPSPRDS